MIHVKNLTYAYPGNTHLTIKNINFSVPAGEIFGVITIFWTYQSFLAHNTPALFIIFTIIATVFQLFLLMLLYRQFRKRIF